MVDWGPFNVSNGPGTVTPDGFRNPIVDLRAAPGDLITQVSGTGTTTFVGGRDDASWDVSITSEFGGNQVRTDERVVQQRLSNPNWTFSWTAPTSCTRALVTFGSSNYAGQTMTCHASGNFSDLLHCAYGTERNPTAPVSLLVDIALLTSLLGQFGVSTLVPYFGAVIGQAIDVTALCSLPPGPLPVVNAEIAKWSTDQQLQFIKVLLWSVNCRCVPGTPSPTPFPTPVVNPGPNVPAPPVFTCSETDLCASIVEIKNTLFQLQKVVGSIAVDTQLIQRYELPFAYINGAVHSNLAGDGHFAVSRLVGLQVVVTKVPEGQKALRGNPPYLWDLGWLTINDSNGLIAEKRLAQQQFVWLPDAMPTALDFRYDLFDGVEIRVTELEAEP